MARIGLLLALMLVVAGCGEDGMAAADLQPGQCFDDPESELVSSLDTIDCEEPHDNEAYANVFLSGTSYPGREGIQDQTFDLCLPEFESYTGVKYEESPGLDYGFFAPTEDSWNDGERVAYCYLYSADLSKLTGSERSSE